MLHKYVLAASLALLAATAVAQQNTASPSFGTVLDRQLSSLEKDMVPMATDMPADKFNFVPSGGDFKTVRNFGEQLKHTAAVNYRLGAAILREKPPATPDTARLKSKEEIVKYLQDSFAYAHRAVTSINEQNALEPIPAAFGGGNANRLGMAVALIGHGRDLYGQLVVYLRMNGIIPPASRR